jgi:hypothetical protein
LKLKIYFERVPHLIEPKSERRLAINIVLAKPSSNRKRRVNWDFTARQLPERPKRARVTVHGHTPLPGGTPDLRRRRVTQPPPLGFLTDGSGEQRSPAETMGEGRQRR